MKDTEEAVVNALAETHSKLYESLQDIDSISTLEYPDTCKVLWRGHRHDGHLTIYLERRVDCINTMFFALISNDVVWGGAIDLDVAIDIDTGSHGNTYSTANARRMMLLNGAVDTVLKAVDTDYPKFVQQQRDAELIATNSSIQ